MILIFFIFLFHNPVTRWEGLWNAITSPLAHNSPPKKQMRCRAFPLRMTTHDYASPRIVHVRMRIVGMVCAAPHPCTPKGRKRAHTMAHTRDSTQVHNPETPMSLVSKYTSTGVDRSHTGHAHAHQTATWKNRMRPQTGSMAAGLITGCTDSVLWGGPQADAIGPGSQHRASGICRVPLKDDVEEQDDENAEDHGE